MFFSTQLKKPSAIVSDIFLPVGFGSYWSLVKNTYVYTYLFLVLLVYIWRQEKGRRDGQKMIGGTHREHDKGYLFSLEIEMKKFSYL